jgi:hypothetical protein
MNVNFVQEAFAQHASPQAVALETLGSESGISPPIYLYPTAFETVHPEARPSRPAEKTKYSRTAAATTSSIFFNFIYQYRIKVYRVHDCAV